MILLKNLRLIAFGIPYWYIFALGFGLYSKPPLPQKHSLQEQKKEKNYI